MRRSPFCKIRWLAFGLLALSLSSAPVAFAQQKAQKRPRLLKPQRLDRGVVFQRDPVTGELRTYRAKPAVPGTAPGASSAGSPPAMIRARVGLVEVNCQVFAADGAPLRGLARQDFRLFEDGVEQAIAHFDASTEPASVALLMDASPSVFRELSEMKAAAQTLADRLAPRDEVAVVSFAGSTHLLLPFTRDRTLLERALTSASLAQVENSKESNIYQAIYLATRELFRDPARRGRKAIILLTDGQDSGLGLGWDPASARPRPGAQANRLTFEDVARELAAAGVEVYAISTQPRPNAMTDAWLESHRSEMLVSRAARELGMPHYTVYLAELVRRAGGRLHFLHEMGTLSAVYRRIAETLGAEYTLGYYPKTGLAKPGWRVLRVELVHPLDARLTHRAAYYVPAAP